MVNDKQAYYEHLNGSFRQFEEPFFDKLVQKNLSLFTLLYYVLDYNSRENEKELSQDGKILLKQKARTKHIDEICLIPLLLTNVWQLFWQSITVFKRSSCKTFNIRFINKFLFLTNSIANRKKYTKIITPENSFWGGFFIHLTYISVWRGVTTFGFSR